MTDALQTTAALRERLLMLCLEKMDDPARALAQASAMARFVDHGDTQNTGLPLALPAPSHYVPSTPPRIDVGLDGTVTGDGRGHALAEIGAEIEAEIPGAAASDIMDDAARIDRNVQGRVNWTPRSLATLKRVVERGGWAEASRVFDQKESSLKVLGYRHGIKPLKAAVVKTKPAREVPAPQVKVRTKPKASGVAGDFVSPAQAKADALRDAIVWLEKNGFELNFDDGLYDVWPKDDDNAGGFSLDKAELIAYASQHGWRA